MRTAAWEPAPPDSFENLLQRSRGEDSIYVILVKGDYMQLIMFIFYEVSAGLCESRQTVVTMKYFSVFLDMRKYKNWTHKISC